MSRTLRLAVVTACLAAASACSGNQDAAADSAAIPNTGIDSMGKAGPIGDSLSPAAPPPTVPPASDTARAPGDTTTRPPR